MAKAFVTTDDRQQVIVAESDDTIVIEGNHYFPPESVNQGLLTDSDTHTTCHWKGQASYKTIQAGGQQWPDGAWYYPRPTPSSIDIVKRDFSNYLAFWRGVQVV